MIHPLSADTAAALASWAMEYGPVIEQAQAAYDLTKLEANKLVEEV